MDQLAAIDVLAVDHVGIAVPDLQAAIDFYTGVLGGVLERTEHNEDQQIDEAMISFGPKGERGGMRADGSAGHDRVQPHPDGARIQLIAPAGPDSTIAKFLDRNGPGLQQLAYRVPDVRAAAATLRASGVRLLYEEPRRGTAGSLINFLHPKDAGGVLIELVQPAGRASDTTACGDGTIAP